MALEREELASRGGIRTRGFQFGGGGDSPGGGSPASIRNNDKESKFSESAHPRDVFQSMSDDHERSGDFAGRRGTYFGTHSAEEAKQRRSLVKPEKSNPYIPTAEEEGKGGSAVA